MVFTLDLAMLGTMNSFNLIDGVDGLAGCVGVVFSITFGMIALLAFPYFGRRSSRLRSGRRTSGFSADITFRIRQRSTWAIPAVC